MSRRDCYAMLHLGAKRLGWDEDMRRAWMEKHAGKRSGRDCTDAELAGLVDLMRATGALDDGRPLGKADTGGKGNDRPTRQQWKLATVLCKERDWKDGIDDPRFAAFVRRIAKVDNPRFLTKNGIRAVIIGLKNWNDFDRKKGEA